MAAPYPQHVYSSLHPKNYPYAENSQYSHKGAVISRNPARNKNNALYHDLSYLQNNFRHVPHYVMPLAQIPPTPQDPYTMVNGYHHFHHEYSNQDIWQCLPDPLMYQSQYHVLPGPGGFVTRTHPTSKIGLVQPYVPQNDTIGYNELTNITNEARSFVEICLPLLGQKPYCLPPIKRHWHPDKSNKKLLTGLESERRVLESFERFFAEAQVPAIMLCNYPLSGFLQVYNAEHHTRTLKLTGQNGQDTVILLLSNIFSVTVMSVNVSNGNSEFDRVQSRVMKAISQMRKMSLRVSSCLQMLGVRSEVRQVIAFPNLKRATMEKACKGKHNLGSLCTLHVDELPAPFEEVGSSPAHKRIFSKWMERYVLCHEQTLSEDDLLLVTGALLSPKLSKVDYVQEGKIIPPIPESIQFTNMDDDENEKFHRMTITIDGVTKPFDEFMNDYVNCYYPYAGERTYRVPPVHFNIQTLKKPSEYMDVIDKYLEITNTSVEPESNDRGNNRELLPIMDNVCHERNNTLPGETRQSVTTSHSVMSLGGNINYNNRTSLPPSIHSVNNVTTDFQFGDSRTPASLGNVTLQNVNIPETQDRSSAQNIPSKHIMHSGVYFKKSPNSSCSLLWADNSATSLSSQNVASSVVGVEGGVISASHGIDQSVLKDVQTLTKTMDKDVRKDEGENRVISALTMLGHQSNLGGQQTDPMFIIGGYQYNNYLNKLKESMFSRDETNRPLRAFGQTLRAEHDCLIFHKKYGAIIVCIKAIGDNFEEWGATELQKIDCTKKILEKMLKQLDREEAMVRYVTSDLKIDLKCYKLIALPNMSRENVKAALWTDLQLKKRIRDTLGHDSDLFLCSDELPPKNTPDWDCPDSKVKAKLLTWWGQVKAHLEDNNSHEIELPLYKQLIARYCGLFSTVEVWSPSNPRVEVRSESEAVKECADRFRQFVLLPCQMKALYSNIRHVFLYGPPGSGKTLILILKARQWLLEEETVVLVNSRPCSKTGYPYGYGVYDRLVQTMKESGISTYKLDMVCIDSVGFREKELDKVTSSSCVIMDEVTPASHKVIESLYKRQVKKIWCAGLFEEDKPHSFSTCKMDKVLRCPPVIQSVLKYTEEAVKHQKPYVKNYLSGAIKQNHVVLLNNDSYNRYIDSLIVKYHLVYWSKSQGVNKEFNKMVTSTYGRTFFLVDPVKRLSLLKLVHYIKENTEDKTEKNDKAMKFYEDCDRLKRLAIYNSKSQIEYKGKEKGVWQKYEQLADSPHGHYKVTGDKNSDAGLRNFDELCSDKYEQQSEHVPLIHEEQERIEQFKSTGHSNESSNSNNSHSTKSLMSNYSHFNVSFGSNNKLREEEITEESKSTGQTSESSLRNSSFRESFMKNNTVHYEQNANPHIELNTGSFNDLQHQRGQNDFNKKNLGCFAHSQNGTIVQTCKNTFLEADPLMNASRQQQQQVPGNLSVSDSVLVSESVSVSDSLSVTHSATNREHTPDSSGTETFQTADLKYDTKSPNDRPSQKYCSRFHITSEKSTLSTASQNYSESLNQRLMNRYRGRLLCKAEKLSINYDSEFSSCSGYDAESMNQRLMEKYGSGLQCGGEQSSSFKTDSQYQSNILFESKYDSEALNIRLMEKYSGGLQLKPCKPSVNHDSQLQSNILYEMKSDVLFESKYDSEALNIRLMEKYSGGLQLKPCKPSVNHDSQLQSNILYEMKSDVLFESKYDSEALNIRLMEKYSGALQLKPCKPSVNHDSQLQSNILYERKSDVLFESKYDSEALNIRLMEKYNGALQLKPCKPSVNHDSQLQSNILYEMKSDVLFESKYDSEALNIRLMKKYNIKFKSDESSMNLLSQRIVRNSLVSQRLQETIQQNDVNSKLPGKTSAIESYSDFLNEALQKYEHKAERKPEKLIIDEIYNGIDYAEMSLPTYGPRPHIIDHSQHSKTGSPADCTDCAHRLVKFLDNMIRPKDAFISQRRKQKPIKNRQFIEVHVPDRNPYESHLTPGTKTLSAIPQKSPSLPCDTTVVFEHRGLDWSDVLIVTKEIAPGCTLVKVLKSKNIPVELCFKGNAHKLEDVREKKLFLTSYKEVTGVERAVIIFIPSGESGSLQNSVGQVHELDFQLADCINRFSLEDKMALWYVASRCLASLVLILP